MYKLPWQVLNEVHSAKIESGYADLRDLSTLPAIINFSKIIEFWLGISFCIQIGSGYKNDYLKILEFLYHSCGLSYSPPGPQTPFQTTNIHNFVKNAPISIWSIILLMVSLLDCFCTNK